MELNGLIVENNGTKCWYLNGITHREDGPAVEYPEGTKKWFLNGKLHREDGPAIECFDGTKYWYFNGQKHRIDGPAVQYTNNNEWWLEGNQISEKEFNILKFNEKISKDLQTNTKVNNNKKIKI